MLPEEDPDEETLRRWHQDPDNWVWGVLYFNPKDKRILVLKRVPLFGFTFNFGNPWSFIIFAVIVAAIIIAGHL